MQLLLAPKSNFTMECLLSAMFSHECFCTFRADSPVGISNEA
jgi:hypothetical protein